MENKNSGYGKKPLWQWIIVCVIIAAVAYGLVYYFAFYNKSEQSYQQPPSSSEQNVVTTPSAANGQNIVTYTDSGFTPSTLTIKKGDTVIFNNTASDAMRVASNPHPVHDGYPTTGGCISSTFDSCKNIAPKSSWSFKFDIAGKWGYHNHLNPSEGGTITVE